MYVVCECLHNAADCAVIPKCIMRTRSSELPLISLCFMVRLSISHNFSKTTCKCCNVKGISPYFELRLCRLTICDCWWPCDNGKICSDCVNFVEYRALCLHPYHNYIHHIPGHSPSCSFKHSGYWSDPILLDIEGIVAFHTYYILFQGINKQR